MSKTYSPLSPSLPFSLSLTLSVQHFYWECLGPSFCMPKNSYDINNSSNNNNNKSNNNSSRNNCTNRRRYYNVPQYLFEIKAFSFTGCCCCSVSNNLEMYYTTKAIFQKQHLQLQKTISTTLIATKTATLTSTTAL
jgi:hypothetical protein